MKIVFDARIHLNYYSGISRYIICLLEAYLEQFSEDELIILVNPTIKPDNSIYKKLRRFSNARFEVIRTAHMGPKNYLVMGRIIKKFKPDVYHYPHLDAPIFTGKIPVVATIHDTNTNNNFKKFEDRFGLKSIYFRKSLSLTLKHAAKVIFVSDSIKEDVSRLYALNSGDARYVRIYNGFEPSFNQLDRGDATRLLNKLNVSGHYFLYVGQIREHKNVDRIIESFKLFQKRYTDFNLVLVGHNYLHRSLNEKGIIHLEKVENQELKALYLGCEAFVFPSLFEGFGFPILEAFSYGKRVITSDYGATKEISGDLADLVDPLRVDRITEKMEQVLTDDGKEERRIHHALQFSWLENARLVREAYKQAIDSMS